VIAQAIQTPRPVLPAEPETARPKLIIENVSKRFQSSRATVDALETVSLDVADGEFVCLIGPSGCGKSTLLDIMAGLTTPDDGRVIADGQVVQGPGRQRLVMFQESALFPWLDAFGNVMFGLKLKPDLTNQERRDIAEHYLRLVGLEKFQHAYIHELSGGMKQRVALARALPIPRCS
jgi:NitT/TauT family transport system ATP-binding protein